MLKKWKKLMAAVCTASLFVTMPGMCVLADEMVEEELIISEIAYPNKMLESADSPVEDLTDDMETPIAEVNIGEEVEGGAQVQVGDGVTATFDADTGAVAFTSQGGELWRDWVEKIGVSRDEIKSIKVASGTVNLPADSSGNYYDNDNNEWLYTLFGGLEKLTNLDLSSFDTTNVTNMGNMFYECHSLSSLDLSSFSTTNVTDMGGMFYECHSLSSLDLSSFDTTNVTGMGGMFYECYSLSSLNLSNFDTTNVANMGYMFYECRNLSSLDLSSFNTTNVTYMGSMFGRCINLTSLDLSDVGTSNVTSMSGMFSRCKNLKNLNLSSFDTSNVQYMDNMFHECGSLEYLDLSNFDVSNVWSTEFMFGSCSKLKELNLSNWVMSYHLWSDYMLYECTGLQILKTPKDFILELPVTMYDRTGTAYSGSDVPPNTTLTRTKMTGFYDVQDPSHPYYSAIYWAAGKGITKGYSDGTFGINRSCTRGEMMMFLWKYAGKPAPKYTSKSPFKDVSNSHAFYKAILWGYQKGITKGYSDGSFGINRNVSRGESMMFLWKLKGRPAPQIASKSPFTDVPTTHAFYKAILWGSQKGITKGYTSGANKGKFGINDNCTRGQIVTFLYRAQ